MKGKTRAFFDFRPSLFLLATLFGFSFASSAQVPPEKPAQPPIPSAPAEVTRVGEIKFEGLQSRTPQELFPKLSTKVGEPYNALLLSEDIGRLAELMRQVTARTEPMPDDKIRIIFTVEEFRRLRELKAIGNVRLSTERIDKIAKLKPGDVLSDRVVKSLRQALITEYQKMGLTEAKVDVNQIPVLPEESPEAAKITLADLQVVVQEGEQVLIKDMDLEGNKAFTTIRLKLLMKTKGSWLFIKNYYDDIAFEKDLADLKNFYNSQGYFDAVVERGEFRDGGMKKGKKIITPVIQIREGERYSLRSVHVRGARLFAAHELTDPFSNLLGKPFEGKKVQRALGVARDLYLDAGFLTTEIKPVYDFDADHHVVDMTLQVTEQDRIYVGKVKLSRPKYEEEENPNFFRKTYNKLAPPVTDEAILREVLLKPGEVYSKSRERDTIRRLDRLGIFSDAEGKPGIRITNEPTAYPRVQDALIELQEGPTGNFGAGVGFGDVSGLFGYVGFNEHNLFGEARDLRIQVQVGTLASSATISYLDRHFQNTDDTLSAAVYYNTYLRPGYKEQVIGTNAEITRPLEATWGDWEAAVRGRLEGVKLSERSGTDADIDLDTSYPVVTGRLALKQDTRFPSRYPTEGRLLVVGLEAGYADGFLLKLTGEGDYYFDLGSDLIFHFNPSAGFMPYDAKSIGLTERLFLGGSNDLRGFEFRGAALRDKGDPIVGVGGSVKLLARNELLFPIYSAISGAFFVDAGLLGSSPVSYDFPRISTGLGLRFNIRQVTAAIDFALPLVRSGDDQTQFVHFSFKGSI